MSYRSSLYPYGSTARLRGDVLATLGVLKIATPRQITALVRPHAQSAKAIRAALLDLARHGLTAHDGYTRQSRPGRPQKLWRLTPSGVQAAAEVLPVDASQSTARGAGRSGAPHTMLVNEVVIAFTRGGTADGTPGGLGTVTSWQTEVPHFISGREAVIADAVLSAPQDGVPVLMVEADRGTMDPARAAHKVHRYLLYYRRTVRLPGARQETPLWRLTYPSMQQKGHPPVAFVLDGAGPRGLAQRMTALEDLTRVYWRARPQQSWAAGADYTDTVPVIATTLPRLQEQGPLGATWRRFGRPGWQSLTTALDNHDSSPVHQPPAAVGQPS